MSDEERKGIRILLDEPVGEDAEAKLGFGDYADVLADVIIGSDSPFTVGIFGDWGTGKTTLMRCIQRRLKDYRPDKHRQPTIIPVWFEAWRYEREEELIAPLLGEIFDAIKAETERAQNLPDNVKSGLAEAGNKFHVLLRSLARASSFKMGVPGLVDLTIDASDACRIYDELLEDLDLPGSSDYREAYRQLKDALKNFAGDKGSNKIVVFVDDLDRCLPEPAVEVLEATKVFLGFEGMVYVLGLKRDIIESCIGQRYWPNEHVPRDLWCEENLGQKYIDKLVQVPFSIPVGTQREIRELLDALADQLPEELHSNFERPEIAGSGREKLYEVIREREEDRIHSAPSRADLIAQYLEHKPRSLKRLLNAHAVSSAIARKAIGGTPEPSDWPQRGIEWSYSADLMIGLLLLRFLDAQAYSELTSDPTSAADGLLVDAAGSVELTAEEIEATGAFGELLTDAARGRLENLKASENGRTANELARRVARLLVQSHVLEWAWQVPELVRCHARAATAITPSENTEAARDDIHYGSIAVNAVAIADGGHVVSGSSDNTVRVWDVAYGGTELFRMGGHAKWVAGVAVSADGGLIISGAADYTVRLWDAQTGKELACLMGHEGPVLTVAVSRDGYRIASGAGAGDNTVRVWDVASGEQLCCLRGHRDSVKSVVFSPDASWLASGSGDSTVRIWGKDTGSELACLRHEAPVYSVAVSPDGHRIISGSTDGVVRVWDADTLEELTRVREQSPVYAVAVSPDGRRIVSGGLSGVVHVWDSDSGEQQACLLGPRSLISGVAVSPDCRLIAAAAHDGTVRVWDAASEEELTCMRVVGETPDSPRKVFLEKVLLERNDPDDAFPQHP